MTTATKKPIWKSKTWWFNLAISLIGFLMSADLSDVLPAQYVGYVLIALGMVNIILRSVTHQGVTLR